MNKKLLMFGAIGLFTVMLVTAALVTYYYQVEQTIKVNQPIEVTGDVVQDIICEAGFTCPGAEITIENDGTQEIDVSIEDVTDEPGITTSYVGTLELTKKDVDFTKENWIVIDGAINKAQVKYTIVGDEFSATTDKATSEAYSLIYYKDNSNRFTNPAQAILVGEVSENLPYETDGNANEYDYCFTEEYDTCHGAKIWYVPTGAINIDGTLDWNQASEFYFESELIQFANDGIITTYPKHSFTITPNYKMDITIVENIYNITTEVNPISVA